MPEAVIDLSKPQFDQSTYWGRAQHFFRVTNPLNLFASNYQLDEAKRIINEYKSTKVMPPGYNAEKLWKTKYLYDSAFHPDTGEKMLLIGRMSAQAPMNTLLGAGMVIFYSTKPALIFWQWLNQSFNAAVNYTNRSGDARLSTRHLVLSYCGACGGAVSTAVYLNELARKSRNPLLARLVPFAAVCAAHFINIPVMRSNELIHGTPVFTDPDGHRVGNSKVAAGYGIFLVCISRFFMILPTMTFTPIITNIAASMGMFCSRPRMVIPFQGALLAICVTIATPLACALFDQRATLKVGYLDKDIKLIIEMIYPKTKQVYFNKGL